ncbi:MAG: ATP-binding protein [Chloroflexi bacterium]|nr:ATP-binding protein [Chloroflexota bacterium]
MKSKLHVLYDVIRAVNSSLDLSEVLNHIISITTGIFEAEAGSVMLLSGSELYIAAASGLSKKIIRNTRVRLGEGIAGWVAKTGEPIILHGRVTDPRFKKVVKRQESISSSLCVPIKYKDRVTGVLMIRRSREKNYTAGEKNFLTAIAAHAGVAIENARLYEEERKKSKQLNREKKRLASILSSMADGVAVLNRDGVIEQANPVLCRFIGNGRRLEGKEFGSVYNDIPFEDIYSKVYEQGKSFFSEVEIPPDKVYRLIVSRMDPGGDSLVAVFHDISEIARAEKVKSEFLSTVSHELKTPITTIRGFLELMAVREHSMEQVKEYIGILLEESERLLRLVEDLLDLSRLESGKFILRKNLTKISDHICGMVSMCKLLSTKHNIILEMEPDLPLIRADGTRVEQVMYNLLINAIKYSPAGGDIVVKVERCEDSLKISIKDHGIGIAAEHHEKIFNRFYRVDTSLTRSVGGTGLGLASAKVLVEAHGGYIAVESEPDKGSTFIFTLPVEGN